MYTVILFNTKPAILTAVELEKHKFFLFDKLRFMTKGISLKCILEELNRI